MPSVSHLTPNGDSTNRSIATMIHLAGGWRSRQAATISTATSAPKAASDSSFVT